MRGEIKTKATETTEKTKAPNKRKTGSGALTMKTGLLELLNPGEQEEPGQLAPGSGILPEIGMAVAGRRELQRKQRRFRAGTVAGRRETGTKQIGALQIGTLLQIGTRTLLQALALQIETLLQLMQ